MFRWIGTTYLRLTGWTVVGERPTTPKYVAVAAPHTSNWDFPILLAVKWALGLEIGFLAKDSLFRGPAGWFFRALGGIAVDRSAAKHLVDQIVEVFARKETMAIAIAPEGTRSYTDAWHSGFYRIALAAHVPVVLGFIDYRTKRAGVGPTIALTGYEEADLATIAAFYADKHGRSPGRFGPVRFAE